MDRSKTDRFVITLWVKANGRSGAGRESVQIEAAAAGTQGGVLWYWGMAAR